MKYIESKTKIIATLGPASSSKEVLREMFINGIDVCRLNFSHGNHDDMLTLIRVIRELNKELSMNVAILADLQGPKLRIGEVENNEVGLIKGEEIVFTNDKCLGTKEKVYMSYSRFPHDVAVGDSVLVDDGKIKLEVLKTDKRKNVICKVIAGGVLSSKKGVNLPKTKITLPSLTEKDKSDAEFAIKNNVDWIALSFVRHEEDIIELKEFIKTHNKTISVIAKVEKPEAVDEIDAIIRSADGIMVARGDLGVEMDFYRVPLIQKAIVEKCLEKKKPVIIATQMLESMIANFRPTRAEANDVANAVLDGADTVMLSGETSIGTNPVNVIQSMHNILQWTENSAYNYNRGIAPHSKDDTFLGDSICYSATVMAKDEIVTAISIFSGNESEVLKISGYRPNAKIYLFTDNRELISKVSLLWAVKAFYFPLNSNFEQAIDKAKEILIEKNEVQKGQVIVNITASSFLKTSEINTLKITTV